MTNKADCLFCNVIEDHDMEISLENETCYFLRKESEQDVLVGSGLIIPKKHKENVFELSKEEWEDTWNLLQRARELLDETFSPDGYSIGWNTGKAGGQSVFHSHLHVIPRFYDEPFAGKGIRHWIKKQENKRDLNT
ncbi:HIT family protein [Bacillus sp. DJP31]|uniref:HIT family protein n=1 Tax=Bacillus sp. DJP31 TaxID=3409789 RepID=UPI003BB70842